MMLARLQALPEDRIMGVETGGCPHTAIREDASINLQAIAAMRQRHPDLDIVFIESGGDNLAATFSPDLADLTLYVISVCQGEEIPRKGGPGITRSDFLVINKSDLAPYVNVNLDVMERDAAQHARHAAVRLHRPVARQGAAGGHRLHRRAMAGSGRMRRARPPDSRAAASRLDQHFGVARPASARHLRQNGGSTMNIARLSKDQRSNLPFYAERVDLACAFRWTARLNMHEAVANHFSLAVDDRRLALPDEPQPGAFLAHQGERSAADRRQRSRDA